MPEAIEPVCFECKGTGYHDNPGPWFRYVTTIGNELDIVWFCRIDCWMKWVRRKHGTS